MLENPKLKKDDRVLILRPIDGSKALSSSGLVDPRLFTGENKLHAKKTPNGTLWYMKYDAGAVPEPLKAKFTTFPQLLDYAKRYFSKRNIEITEVID